MSISPYNLLLDEKLKRLAREFARDHSLVIFGSNAYAPIIVELAKKHGFMLEAIFDNQKNGTTVDGVPVVLPRDAQHYPNAIIVIASAYYNEMSDQLLQLGYTQDQIFSLFNMEYYTSKRDLLDPLLIERYAEIAVKGEQIQTDILSTVSPDAEILLSPFPCIGDMYLMCLNLYSYLKKEAVSEYVIAAAGTAACELARRFGHTNVYQLSTDEADALILYRILVGEQMSCIHICNGYAIYTSPFRFVYGRSGLTWFDYYNRFLYQLETEDRTYPMKSRLSDEMYTRLLSDGFAEGHTIILSPYANSVRMLDLVFWEQLASVLNAKGYVIYTNVSPREKEIKGTRRMEIPLEYIDDVIEKAGTLIAMRSGFCDVTSQAKCKRIVLYPNAPWFGGSAFKGLSLKRMNLCRDVFEYIASGNDEVDIHSICDYVGELI